MGDLIVKASYQLGPRDVLTVDKLNLMATPIVELALSDPVNDQNFFRNGNFYSSFWATPAGVSCPVNVWTSNANYWQVRPQGAAVTFLRSQTVPDQFSLFSAEVQGAAAVSTVEFAQQISGDLSATLRRKCTFSGYADNATGLTISPVLNIYTCNTFNNFNTVTLQTTVNLQTLPNATWTLMTATIDLSTAAFTNVQNGLLLAIQLPAGAINDPSKNVLFSRLKFQIGEVATEFVDDTSLFVQAPSVDSTMLQDGCIARPSLFLPNVVPTGAYQAKSINNGDINDGAIDGRTMASGATVANLGFTPVNKAGDTAVGIIDHAVDTVVGATAPGTSGVVIEVTEANKANDGYFPSIGFKRGTSGNTRAVGLSVDGRLKTVDNAGVIGYLLDSVHQVDTASIQDKAVTLQKLSDALVNLIIPPGIVQAFAGPNTPTGWIVCDGAQYLQTDFPGLYTAIGGTYGSGGTGASAWFKVPDFRGRNPIGYVNSPVGGITARAFGSSGGEEYHVLSTPELASHNHTLHDGAHSHNVIDPQHSHIYINPYGTTGTAPGGSPYPSGATSTNAASTNISIQASGANISIDPAGSNAGHNTMQPFVVIYWIIKT